jgi:hypothetical protein
MYTESSSAIGGAVTPPPGRRNSHCTAPVRRSMAYRKVLLTAKTVRALAAGSPATR